MGHHRLKHSFTAGELSPLMNDRVDFERYSNGCRTLKNMVCATQGPARRRPGTRFIYDLNDLGIDTFDPQIRMIPFVFNEEQAYAMIFFMHTDGQARMVVATDVGLVVYPNPVPPYCPPEGTEIQVPNPDYDPEQPEDPDTNPKYITEDISEPVDPSINPGDVVMLTLPVGWDNTTFDWAQSADEMYISQTGLNPHVIQRYGHTCWVLISKTFADQPAIWSDEAGWPERVTFHQQRLVFAASFLKRQTVWMTEAGDFNSFSISSPLVDSDAVTFTLDSGTQNKIRWLASGKSLHVGTLGNEWTVSGNDRSSLTPSNILAQRQTNSGSEPNKPLLVGLTTLFVERYGRTVNEFVYDYTYDSYKTTDMAILSPHVTEHYSITDWTYQQTPDSIIWCTREDGYILGITYQRQHKVVGWHRHDTQGQFKAVTCIPGDTREDDVWLTAEREIEGATHFYVEKMYDFFKGEKASEGQFLDCSATYEGEPASTLSGYQFLAGKTADVLADGTVHPSVLVAADGSVQLNNKYSKVLVGLGYASEVRPHLADIKGSLGTSMGRMQRITKIAIDYYKSLGGQMGRIDEETGEEHVEDIPFRTPTDLMGVEVPLHTGWYSLDFPEGFDHQSDYFLRQEQPLPFTIRGVMDNVEVHD